MRIFGFLKLIHPEGSLWILVGCMLILSACGQSPKSVDERNSLYDLIDEEIEKSARYDAEKQQRISNLKERLKDSQTLDQNRRIADDLILEYEAFISDSALRYINLNLENPEVKNNETLRNRLLIKKADISAHAGLFGAANDILESIDNSTLDPSLREEYFGAYCDLYQYQCEYSTDSEFSTESERLRELYIDSLTMVSPVSSVNYIINVAAREARNKNYEMAESLLLDNLNKYHSGERNYSIIASILADIYKQKEDKENYHKYLSVSVISDIRGAVKENMAIRALATECFQEGDLERADKYLRQSFADANFYAARMRNAQSSRMLPIIGEAYNNQQKELNHRLRLLVIFISILAFGFIIISVFALLQIKKIRSINKKTKNMLGEVSRLSEQLKEVNKELSDTNNDLKTSNKIQGEYGVLFMEYCSMAISALHRYQQSLKVLANEGNIPNLMKKINSGGIENKTIAEFYSKFDEAVLNIYPNFVNRFNALLKPEERVDINPNDGLNTELRVFALIRIGISDSEKIAKFLRCSLSTVYTYRSKTKKKAIDPDKFEENLMEI